MTIWYWYWWGRGRTAAAAGTRAAHLADGIEARPHVAEKARHEDAVEPLVYVGCAPDVHQLVVVHVQHVFDDGVADHLVQEDLVLVQHRHAGGLLGARVGCWALRALMRMLFVRD